MIGAKYRAYWIFVKKQILNMLFMLYYFLIFNKIFRAQISLGGPQRSQMSGNPADIRRDRHAVIVENHDHLGFGSADIV